MDDTFFDGNHNYVYVPKHTAFPATMEKHELLPCMVSPIMVWARVTSAIAIIVDVVGFYGPRFLAVSRKDDPFDLGFPGGKVEFGETLEEAVRREVQEEVGLHVINSRLFFTSPARTRMCSAFFAHVAPGEPKSMEGSRVAWVRPHELVTENCTFRTFNRKLFDALAIRVE